MTNLRDITNSLIDKYGLSKADAEHFISEMFGIVIDELSKGGVGSSVKIKGLGVFKVTSVNSRSSVDINTGEKIVIDGRNKISFTPETSLRDRVNAPFSQFETVLLNEDVDFSNIDREEIIDSSQNPHHKKINTDNVLIDDELENDEDDNLSTIDNCTDDDNNDGNNENQDDEGDVTTIKQEQTINTIEQSVVQKLMMQGEDNEVSEENAPHPMMNDECQRHRYRLSIILSLSVFFIVLCFGFAGVLLYNYYEESNNRINKLEAKILKHPYNTTRKSCDEFPRETSSKEMVRPIPNSSCKDSTIIIKKDSINTNAIKISQDYDSDPRIRTGAYIIVGINKTIKIRQGQTLESISKQYFGDGMECYVEAVNNYRQLKPGDSIKIPVLKLKPRRH